MTTPVLLRSPSPTSQAREVLRLVDAVHGTEGEGFAIRRPFPGALSFAEADPFLLLDHMGHAEYGPGEARGTAWHPHRGFETVTYLLAGEFEHEDSTGGGGLLTAGSTQWMTAGAGILHVERPSEHLLTHGGVLHGLQLWVNLPASKKLTTPRYQGIGGEDLRLAATAEGGALARIIAGTLGPATGPGVTHTPISYVHLSVQPGARAAFEWPEEFNTLGYVLGGAVTVGPSGPIVTEGQLVRFGPGGHLDLRGGSVLSEAILLGGVPLREPVVQYGPFVMNSRPEILEAIEDFNAGRLGRVPALT